MIRKIVGQLLLLLVLLAATGHAQLWESAEYAGSFRVPHKPGGASRFAYAGHTMALGADGSTLWMEGHTYDEMMAEVRIPELVKSRNPAEYRKAEVVTPFTDISQGRRHSKFGGMAVSPEEGRIWWTLEEFYDVSPDVWPSIGWTSLDLAEAHGPWMADVGNKLTERYIQLAPRDIADTQFGGRYLLTGQAGVAGTAGSSQGFCLTAVEAPTEEGQTLSTQKLLFYPMDHPLPMTGPERGHWYRSEKCPSMAWVTVSGRHYVAFTAIVGTGPVWYGPWDEPPEGGVNDVWRRAKGYHAPPYEERLYFYALEEILRVARGEIETWEARPMQAVDLRPYLLKPGHRWCCLAYDPAKQRLYISEDKGDDTQSRYETVPVVHAFDLGEPVPPEPPPEEDPCEELRQRLAEVEAELVACQEEAGASAARIQELEAVVAELEAKIQEAREALE